MRSSPDPEALLSEWREAEEGSIGWRYARFYECALDVLSVAMDAPREEVA